MARLHGEPAMSKVTVKNTFVDIGDELPNDGDFWGKRQLSEPPSVPQYAYLEPSSNGHALTFKRADITWPNRSVVEFTQDPRAETSVTIDETRQENPNMTTAHNGAAGETEDPSPGMDELDQSCDDAFHWQRLVTEELWQDSRSIDVDVTSSSTYEVASVDSWRRLVTDEHPCMDSAADCWRRLVTDENWDETRDMESSEPSEAILPSDASVPYPPWVMPVMWQPPTAANLDAAPLPSSGALAKNEGGGQRAKNQKEKKAKNSRHHRRPRFSLIDLAKEQQEQQRQQAENGMQPQMGNMQHMPDPLQGASGFAASWQSSSNCDSCGGKTKPTHKFCLFCGAALKQV